MILPVILAAGLTFGPASDTKAKVGIKTGVKAVKTGVKLGTKSVKLIKAATKTEGPAAALKFLKEAWTALNEILRELKQTKTNVKKIISLGSQFNVAMGKIIADVRAIGKPSAEFLAVLSKEEIGGKPAEKHWEELIEKLIGVPQKMNALLTKIFDKIDKDQTKIDDQEKTIEELKEENKEMEDSVKQAEERADQAQREELRAKSEAEKEKRAAQAEATTEKVIARAEVMEAEKEKEEAKRKKAEAEKETAKAKEEKEKVEKKLVKKQMEAAK